MWFAKPRITISAHVKMICLGVMRPLYKKQGHWVRLVESETSSVYDHIQMNGVQSSRVAAVHVYDAKQNAVIKRRLEGSVQLVATCAWGRRGPRLEGQTHERQNHRKVEVYYKH